MAALQSWAGAGLLGMIRALIRDDDQPYLGRSRHGDLPDGWDDSLVAEIALALAVSVPSAEKTTRAAWELGARLPGVELLLQGRDPGPAAGPADRRGLRDLSDENAARAEELLLPELTEPRPARPTPRSSGSRPRSRPRSTRAWPSGGARRRRSTCRG